MVEIPWGEGSIQCSLFVLIESRDFLPRQQGFFRGKSAMTSLRTVIPLYLFV
jgi:hypothetical protein